jgi:hypothetical protein
MSLTTARRWLMIGAPLAFAALLQKFHPVGGDDFYTLVSENSNAWLTVHYGAAVMFPLMGYLIWLLVRDIPGRAATVTRIALPIYAVFYGVFEALVGLASGIVAQQSNGMTGAAREGVAEAVNGIMTHPILGDAGVFSSIGSVAWLVAIAGAILALRQVGVGHAALVLLGLGTFMAVHVPPIGPAALICLSSAAFLIERHRTATGSASLRPLPREAMIAAG